jgi:hypothetical protein
MKRWSTRWLSWTRWSESSTGLPVGLWQRHFTFASYRQAGYTLRACDAARAPSNGIGMSILARLQRIVRAEFNAASAAIDDVMTSEFRSPAPSVVSRAPAELRRERASAYDWLAGIEADAAAALLSGDSVRARSLLQHAAYAESVLSGNASVVESGAWPATSQQRAPVSAPAQPNVLPRNPYGVAAPVIRVRQAPAFSTDVAPSLSHGVASPPSSGTEGPHPHLALLATVESIGERAVPSPRTSESTAYAAISGAERDALYTPAMDALLDRFEQTAARVETHAAMAEVDALLNPPGPDQFHVPPPESAPDSGSDPLERLRRNLDPET